MLNLTNGMLVTDTGDTYKAVYRIISLDKDRTLVRRVGSFQNGTLDASADRGETYRKTVNLREHR